MKVSACVLSLLALLWGASTANAGTVCINRVRISDKMHVPLGEGQSSQQPEDPNQFYKFTVSVGSKSAVAASHSESVLIKDVPTNKPQIVAIRLNDRPYTAFPLRFSDYKTSHVCLWLNDLYLTWSISAMSESRGRCSCKV